jgi:hypothetical protein
MVSPGCMDSLRYKGLLQLQKREYNAKVQSRQDAKNRAENQCGDSDLPLGFRGLTFPASGVYPANQSPVLSGVESKPATKGRIKTSQSEAGYSYQFFRFIQAVSVSVAPDN